jgi:hypothetical protein
MASTLVLGLLAWFHILSAIGWLGTDITLLLGVEPGLDRLTPAAKDELMTTIFPRLNRLEMIFASATVLFGLLFAYEFTGGDLTLLSPAKPWGLTITVGATLGFVAFLLEALVEYPSEKRVIEIVRELRAKNQLAPTAELSRYHERSEFAEVAVLILLLATLTFMVASATL